MLSSATLAARAASIAASLSAASDAILDAMLLFSDILLRCSVVPKLCPSSIISSNASPIFIRVLANLSNNCNE